MSTAELREELKIMIDKESDTSVLEALRVLLNKSGAQDSIKEELISRALKSEEDIAANRVYSRDEFENILTQRLKG